MPVAWVFDSCENFCPESSAADLLRIVKHVCFLHVVGLYFRSKSKRHPLSMETVKRLGKSFNAKNFASLDKRQETELEEATWKET